MKEPNLPVYCSHGIICSSSIFVIARNFHLVPLFLHNTKSWHGLFFPQAIGLSLRDLLARVDEEIHRLDPSSHKEVSMNLRERFFILSRAWDKEKIPSPHEESNLRPLFYHCVTETLRWVRSVTKFIWHASCVLLGSAMSITWRYRHGEKGKLANEHTTLGERHQDSRTFFFAVLY